MAATVLETPPARKAPKAFYCELYNGETHGVLTQVHGVLSIFTDAGAILDYTPAMAPG